MTFPISNGLGGDIGQISAGLDQALAGSEQWPGEQSVGGNFDRDLSKFRADLATLALINLQDDGRDHFRAP